MIPEFLIKRIKEEYGEELSKKIIGGYSKKRETTFRVNTIKTSKEHIEEELIKNKIQFERSNMIENGYIVKNTDIKLEELEIYKNGEIYVQSLSSMLPPIILNPKENTDILDMTAAPGGKTTQIAALTNNKANITACEMNSIRIEKLKYNIEKQSATSVYIMSVDSRKIDNFFSFDQILLDAPCSGSGTLNVNENNSNFTEELIKKSVKSQKALLDKALKILKPNHEMVYSTCSILKEENEEVILDVLKRYNVKIIPIEIEKNGDLPLLPTKIDGTLCLYPNELYEGFFIAKLKKQ